MPPFPERESSILAKLKKKKPSSVPEGTEVKEHTTNRLPMAQMSNNVGEAHPPTTINLMSQVGYMSTPYYYMILVN
jgi:AP-2 complex subunit alpha